MLRLLDLFCGAGGAAMGYHRAGWEVVGVDLRPQPHYPFAFHQADALTFPLDGFDAVHASPPCQRWSRGARGAGTTQDHPDLIGATRDRVSGLPFVIENVELAAPELRAPLLLCGAMFGLGVLRHRLFEVPPWVTAPAHQEHLRRIGDGYSTVAGHSGGSSTRDRWSNGTGADWRAAMGIGWMTNRELAEAVPPAYTEHIGRQLRQRLLCGPVRASQAGPGVVGAEDPAQLLLWPHRGQDALQPLT